MSFPRPYASVCLFLSTLSQVTGAEWMSVERREGVRQSASSSERPWVVHGTLARTLRGRLSWVVFADCFRACLLQGTSATLGGGVISVVTVTINNAGIPCSPPLAALK